MKKYFDFKYAEISQYLANAKKPENKYQIRILRDSTVEPIEPYLKYLGFDLGLSFEISYGEYGNMVQELHSADLSSSKVRSADLVIVMQTMRDMDPSLYDSFSSLSMKEAEEKSAHIKSVIDFIVDGLQRNSISKVLWLSLDHPSYPNLGIADSVNGGGQMHFISSLNEYLRVRLRTADMGYVVDLAACVSRVGSFQFYDERNWHLSRCLYSLEGFREIALELSKYIRALTGRVRKCIVLDCDNTLWGGVVGEDGVFGVQLGDGYPGSLYQTLQKSVLNLSKRGVLVALCSKNEEASVWSVFDRRSDMVLKRENISSYRINWSNKASNIMEIAKELNISTNSLVFVDDSEFELSLVEEILPEVECVKLDRDTLLNIDLVLNRLGGFDSLSISDEDRLRGEMYIVDAKRTESRELFVDVESYLRSLSMRLVVAKNEGVLIPRAAQLTQRTNQFNLSTKRYSEHEMRAFVGSPDWDVVSFSLEDKFGSLGIIGLAIIRYENNEAWLDSFLMSCRAIGRGVESSMLAYCACLVDSEGMRVMKAEFYPTSKNAIIEQFFDEICCENKVSGEEFSCYEIPICELPLISESIDLIVKEK